MPQSPFLSSKDGKPTHVAHFFPVWLPLTMRWLYDQVKFLPQNIEPHIVCDTTENESFQDVNITCHKNRLSRSADHLARYFGIPWKRRLLSKRLGSGNIPLLHSHFGHVGWQNTALCERLGKKHIVTFYGNDVHQLPKTQAKWRKRYPTLFAKADRILCEGPFMRQSLIDQGASPTKTLVHPLGVDVDGICFLKRALIEGKPIRILMASTFREKKGIPLGLRAIHQLQSACNLQLVLVGASGKDGRDQEANKIETLLSTLHFIHPVERHGFLDNRQLHELAESCHLFLAPSLTASNGDCEGGCPVVILEMLASGLPIVSTRHCDIPQAVKHGENGFLAYENNLESLVAELKTCLEFRERWPELGMNGRRHVEIHLNAKKQGLALAAVYLELLSESE